MLISVNHTSLSNLQKHLGGMEYERRVCSIDAKIQALNSDNKPLSNRQIRGLTLFFEHMFEDCLEVDNDVNFTTANVIAVILNN